jgi:hypothetical protein
LRKLLKGLKREHHLEDVDINSDIWILENLGGQVSTGLNWLGREKSGGLYIR